MRFIFRVRTLRMQYNQGLLARSTNMIHTVKQERTEKAWYAK